MSDMMAFPETVEEFMEAYKVVDEGQVYSNGTEFVPIYRMRQWFEHIAHKQQEPCEDTISRQAAIAESLSFIVEYYGAAFDEEMQVKLKRRLESLPSAEPKIHDDGTLEVSVSDALKVKRVLVGDAHQWGGFYYPDGEPKTGRWIKIGECKYRCDQCGKIVFADDSNELNYCSHCGAKMLGEDGEA